MIVVLIIAAIGLLPTVATVWAEAHLLDPAWRQSGPDTTDISEQSTEIQVVPAASFIQVNDTNPATDDANNWLFNLDDGFLSSDSATDTVCLTAPVYLVSDSTIESFTVYVVDESSSNDLIVFLDQTTLLGNWIEVARVSTSGQTSGIQTLTDATIGTTDRTSADYHYHISFCLPANSGGNIRIYGAQVGYAQVSGTIRSVYLPILFKSEPPPPTRLLITNQTGGALDYTVLNTPEGNINCTIPNGATSQLCGTFTAGVYHFTAVAHCGQKVGQRTYKPGDDALTPFRCI
jgi:hypothetical protein